MPKKLNGKIGTCTSMCPPCEIKRRTDAKKLHSFEIKEESKKDEYQVPNLSKVVKEFARSSAGVIIDRVELLRPPTVLRQTMSYLITEIIPKPKSEVPWNIVYDFVFDRMRAIRQDLVIQEITGPDKIYIFEQMTMFHLFAAYYLCDQPPRLYDSVINDNHLRECLQILLVQYNDCGESYVQNRSIFEALYLLFNIGRYDAIARYGKLPESVKAHPRVKNALKLVMLFNSKNYLRLLKEVSSLDIYGLLSIHCKIGLIQKLLFERIALAYSAQGCKFPLKTLAGWLAPFEKRNRALGEWLEEIITKCEQECFPNGEMKYVKFSKSTLKSVDIDKRKWIIMDNQLEKKQVTDILLLRIRS